MTKLTRLDVGNTKVTDAGLDVVKGFADLDDLALGSSGVTDAGLAKLHGLKKLKWIHLYEAKQVTAEGVAALTKAIPGLKVNR